MTNARHQDTDAETGRRSWVYDGVDEYRPSLSNLDRRQQDILDELVDGFGSQKDVIRWVQRLGIVTLGRLPDRWTREAPLSRSMLSLLIVTPERREHAVNDEPPDLDVAREFREELAGKLLPYHNEAVRDFRESAVEYLNDDERPDPAKAESVAHRPSLSELDERQRRALDALLEGRIESRRDVVGWARSLNLATEGEIGDLASDGDRGFLDRVVGERGTLAVLVVDESEPASHETARIRFAAYHLLPAFNAGVRSLWSRAGEDTSTESEGLSSTSL